MSDTISKREYDKDGFTVIVKRIFDTDPDLSYLEQDYYEDTPEDRAKYRKQDAERLKAYNRGNWHMLGIAVEIRKQTSSNWANGGLEVGRASVWGFESDSDESFLKSEEENITAEAWAEVGRLKQALRSPKSHLSRAQVAERLAKYYTEKMNGPVRCSFDPDKRAYCIQGEGLPSHPDLSEQYPNGWSMLDYVKPGKARQLVA